MKKLSRKKVIMIVFVLAALTALAGWFLIDNGFARLLVLLSILVVTATVLATNLDKEGPRSILLMASPLISTLFSKLSKFGLADNLTDTYNRIIAWLIDHLEIESDFSFGKEDSLLITFWLLVAAVYGIICVVKWIKAREKSPNFERKIIPKSVQHFV